MTGYNDLIFFSPTHFIGGELQNVYSTMLTVTICSELGVKPRALHTLCTPSVSEPHPVYRAFSSIQGLT